MSDRENYVYQLESGRWSFVGKGGTPNGYTWKTKEGAEQALKNYLKYKASLGSM